MVDFIAHLQGLFKMPFFYDPYPIIGKNGENLKDATWMLLRAISDQMVLTWRVVPILREFWACNEAGYLNTWFPATLTFFNISCYIGEFLGYRGKNDKSVERMVQGGLSPELPGKAATWPGLFLTMTLSGQRVKKLDGTIVNNARDDPKHLQRQFGICGAPFFHPPTYPRWQPQWVLSDKIMIIAS